MSKLFEQQKGNGVTKQLQTLFHPERQVANPSSFESKAESFSVTMNAMRGTGAGGVRSKHGGVSPLNRDYGHDLMGLHR